MDAEALVHTAKENEQLPEVRRVARLSEIPKIIPPKKIITAEKTAKPKQDTTGVNKYLIICIAFAFFGISLFELAVIKRLSDISSFLKDKNDVLKQDVRQLEELQNKTAKSRMDAVGSYIALNQNNKILQFKIDDFKGISRNKERKTDSLKGDIRVSYARMEAVKAQNELLINKLREQDKYVSEISDKLINSIKEQELLIKDNLRIKQEREALQAAKSGTKEEEIMLTPKEDVR